MHKVERNSAPQSLLEKNTKYLEKLTNNVKVDKPWNSLTKKERKDIIEKLNEIYVGCCAYCEGYVESTGSPYIDHFKPQILFPELIFEYNNMNYSCQKCNTMKKDIWNDLLFSPTKENPEEHITFEGEWANPKDSRGSEMIKVLQLNDSKRLMARKQKYDLIKNFIDRATEKINTIDLSNEESKNNCIERFNDAYNSYLQASNIGTPYCTMIKHNFSKEIETLKEKIQKITKM